jgi:ABC-type branched-subunit amino acid transport system ATPase component
MIGAPQNPFSLAQHRAGVLPYLPADAVDGIWARLLETRVGQLIGAEGTGKTTCLRALGRLAAARGFEFFESRDPGELSPRANVVLGLDEADASPRRTVAGLRRECRAKTAMLLLVSHRALHGIPIMHTCRVDPEMSVEIVKIMLARSPELPRLVSSDEVFAALALSKGNLRLALSDLYDLYEQRWAELMTWGDLANPQECIGEQCLPLP